MSTLDLMQQHPGEWYPVTLDELASLVTNPEQVGIYRVAKERGFRILTSCQDKKMYVRITFSDGRESTYETSMVGRRPQTGKLRLPVE
jgi:hypothetical protein